ncbi:MAG: GntR family transcriptional regulator [Planctomycetota bacterium]
MSAQHLPPSRRLADALARDIRAGALPVGSLLPPERTLAAQHGTSRGALRCAYAILRGAGLIEPIPQRGWRVRAGAVPAVQAVTVWIDPGQTRFMRLLQERGEIWGLRFRAEPSIYHHASSLPADERAELPCWRELDVCAMPALRSVAAHVVVGPGTHYPVDLLEHIAAQRPLVRVFGQLTGHFDLVDRDNEQAARGAVELAVAAGARRVAYLGMRSVHERNANSRQRLLGYHDAMQRLGLRPQVLLTSRRAAASDPECQAAIWRERFAASWPPPCLLVTHYGNARQRAWMAALIRCIAPRRVISLDDSGLHAHVFRCPEHMDCAMSAYADAILGRLLHRLRQDTGEPPVRLQLPTSVRRPGGRLDCAVSR